MRTVQSNELDSFIVRVGIGIERLPGAKEKAIPVFARTNAVSEISIDVLA